jgi:Serine protease inhibitor
MHLILPKNITNLITYKNSIILRFNSPLRAWAYQWVAHFTFTLKTEMKDPLASLEMMYGRHVEFSNCCCLSR